MSLCFHPWIKCLNYPLSMQSILQSPANSLIIWLRCIKAETHIKGTGQRIGIGFNSEMMMGKSQSWEIFSLLLSCILHPPQPGEFTAGLTAEEVGCLHMLLSCIFIESWVEGKTVMHTTVTIVIDVWLLYVKLEVATLGIPEVTKHVFVLQVDRKEVIYIQMPIEAVGWEAMDSITFSISSLPALIDSQTLKIDISYENTEVEHNTVLLKNTGIMLLYLVILM